MDTYLKLKAELISAVKMSGFQQAKITDTMPGLRNTTDVA